MATILYPDGRTEEIQPQNNRDFKLEELQKIVGGHIEILPLRDGRIMVINEEGKLLDLSRNEQATALANLPTPEERAAIKNDLANSGVDVIDLNPPYELDYIAGTVLVCQDHEVR